MAQRDDIKRKKRKQKKLDFTPYIIIGVLGLIVLAVVILSSIKPVGEVVDPTFHKATITDGLTMGDPNAPVKLIEFADFQCPGCGYYWSNMEPDIISKYVETGQVFYTYAPFSFVGDFVRNNPWDESKKAAEAAYCANDQGKFWEYRDYIYANQNGENKGAFTRVRLLEFAKRLDLDNDAFKKCFDSGQHTQTVLDANDFAITTGITSTPSFTINGEIVDSTNLEAAILAALPQE